MEPIINISQINDFIYCPKSLYLHNIYSNFDTQVYHDQPQTSGKIAHENIDNNSYTTSRHILQGISIYSEKLKIKGKIDIYDTQRKCLIERKYRVRQVYLGYRYQLFAQMYCVQEIGMIVSQLYIHSLADNIRHVIPLPDDQEKHEFELLINRMREFDHQMLQSHSCNNCDSNIYSQLNW